MNIPEELKEKLAGAKNVLVFTGAGMSAESGIPTFRGKDGIWNKLKPEELASFDAFLKNPDLVWEWYQHRRKIIFETEPNAGHRAIAELQEYYNVTVVTQNVDNLHNRAGSKTVYELHGNIERNYCVDCKTFYSQIDLTKQQGVPSCKKCGGLIRPDVVWFGEYLPQEEFASSELAAKNSDICFIIGTTAAVYPAAYIPFGAKSAGAYLIEINTDDSEITREVDFSFRGAAGEVLPQLLAEIKILKTIK